MSNEVMSLKEMAGPEITGTVTVNLKELDKMRTDHAKWKKLAEELLATEKMVKVQFTEKKEFMEYSRYSGRYIKDDKFVETGTQYFNLDDVRESIREEEMEKIRESLRGKDNKIDSLTKKADSISTDRDKVLEENKLLEKEVEGLKDGAESTGKELAEAKDKIVALEGLNAGFQESISRLTKDLELTKNKKGFWSFLY